MFRMVIVALLLRLAVVPFNRFLFEDLMDADHVHAWEQGNVARALLAGHGFGSPFASDQPSAIMPPLYPLVVAGFFRVLGVHTARSIFAIHAFDCLTNALACIPLFLIALRGFGRRLATWVGWGWAFFPYGIYFGAAWAWSTHLLLLGLCWLIFLSQRMDRSASLGLWAGFGLLAGFTGLTEPSSLTVAACLMALSAWRLARAGNRWFAPWAAASVVLILVISPWLIGNAVRFHRFVPMRDSFGLELWMGNNGHNLRWTSDDLHPLHDVAELRAYNRLGEQAYMDAKSRQAWLYISRHALWYAGMCARRAVYLWTGYWSFDPRYLAEEPTDPENIPFASFMTLAGLVGLYLLFKARHPDALRYTVVLLVLPAIYYFTHPEPYHMRAIDPVTLLLGCCAACAIKHGTRSFSWIPRYPSPAKNSV